MADPQDVVSPHVVILSGAGISAESGIKTFRDSDGLWEGYNVEEVATPQAWKRDPELVQQFYNERRKQVLEASPNPAHKALVRLEEKYRVTVVTQNIDDLHERAGSSRVLHLHGEIVKARSSQDPDLFYPIEGHELKMGQKCELGSQLRPHVVWFGEAVPMMDSAIEVVRTADFLIIVGTSLVVYPAAGLAECAPYDSTKILIDPKIPHHLAVPDFRFVEQPASTGVPEIVEELLQL